MGGYGSGNHYQWWRPVRKTTVEECFPIDANRWAREGILKAGVRSVGNWQWKHRRGLECSIGYEVQAQDMGRPLLRLFYTFKRQGEPQQEDYQLRLTTTVPRFGGLRWWFVCPLIRGQRPCNRRVGKLYLPLGGRYFGCRHCHGLTYNSCRESRKPPALLRRIAVNLGMGVGDVNRIMKHFGKEKDL